MTVIYGVDSEQPVSPAKVRDAIVRCFTLAHLPDVGIDIKDEKLAADYCRDIVAKSFANSGGDFNKPTKESIIKALSELVKIASQFRDKEVISQHYNEIMALVEKL